MDATYCGQEKGTSISLASGSVNGFNDLNVLNLKFSFKPFKGIPWRPVVRGDNCSRQAGDLSDDSLRDQRALAELFPLVDVGDVHFDRRNSGSGQGMPKRHA